MERITHLTQKEIQQIINEVNNSKLKVKFTEVLLSLESDWQEAEIWIDN